MKKLLENRGVRVLAFLLCLLFGLGTIACGFGFAWDYFEQGLTGERNFAGSDLARMYVNNQVWNALHAVCYRPSAGEEYFLTPPEEGFSYIVYEPDGGIAADTRLDTSWEVPPGAGSYWELDGYTARAYVNLPAQRGTRLWNAVTLYDICYNGRNVFLPLAIGQLILTLLLFVFLLAAAGRTPEGVRLGGVHRWPLELYLGLLAAVFIFPGLAGLYLGDYFVLDHMVLQGLGLGACILCCGAAALLACMTLAARFRAGQWWRNTLTFCILRFFWRLFRWLVRTVRSVAAAIPVAWKTGLIYCGVVFLNLIGFLLVMEDGIYLLFLFLLDLAGLGAAVIFGSQMHRLREAGRALAAGDLSYTVDTKKLWWDLREHGENLNAVNLGLSRAVNERMKSERFKTELITNVSHDLKTPLTSIVNYVDLLKKENIEGEQAKEYIEVLDRQSQRLKKLTTDLVDASKASSGAMSVNLERVDLAEMARQSVGEYAERFALAGVEPVLSLPEGDAAARADGRLLWRVLDNLLLNVTKYAQSGTRCYLDLVRTGDHLEFTVKNISREPLNIPAEELLERFVRGDAARHTEGSGLGLSIARSLMELMGGALRLTLDGDLFKVTLEFPAD